MKKESGIATLIVESCKGVISGFKGTPLRTDFAANASKIQCWLILNRSSSFFSAFRIGFIMGIMR